MMSPTIHPESGEELLGYSGPSVPAPLSYPSRERRPGESEETSQMSEVM